MKTPFVPALIQKLAPEFGITVILEEQWHRLGEMILPNGERRFFLGTDIGVNNSAAAAIAQDKAYTQTLCSGNQGSQVTLPARTKNA